MNNRFDIFMKSIDDDLLEEAQLYIPRKRGFFKAIGLAACLCIVMGAYYLSFGSFGAKSEAATAPDNLYSEVATTAACAQGEAVTESAVMTTANESSPAPTMASSPSSPLPANAIVC